MHVCICVNTLLLTHAWDRRRNQSITLSVWRSAGKCPFSSPGKEKGKHTQKFLQSPDHPVPFCISLPFQRSTTREEVSSCFLFVNSEIWITAAAFLMFPTQDAVSGWAYWEGSLSLWPGHWNALTSHLHTKQGAWTAAHRTGKQEICSKVACPRPQNGEANLAREHTHTALPFHCFGTVKPHPHPMPASPEQG